MKYQRARSEIIKEAKRLLLNRKKEYPLLRKLYKKPHILVFDVIENHFQKYEEIISVKNAADHLENILEKELLRLRDLIKKGPLRSPFML